MSDSDVGKAEPNRPRLGRCPNCGARPGWMQAAFSLLIKECRNCGFAIRVRQPVVSSALAAGALTVLWGRFGPLSVEGAVALLACGAVVVIERRYRSRIELA